MSRLPLGAYQIVDTKPDGRHRVGRKGKGRKPVEGVAGKLGPERQEAFEVESIKQITAYVKDKAKDDKPFFIYSHLPISSVPVQKST